MKEMTFGRKFVTIATLIVLVWMSIGIIIYRSFSVKSLPKVLSKTYSEYFKVESAYCDYLHQKESRNFWQTVNLHEKEILQTTKDFASTIAVHSNFVTVKDVKVHYLSAKLPKFNSSISVLFLHGQSFTSKIWTKLGTMQLLAAMGYYTVAVDLPGYGGTQKSEDLNKVEFMHDLIMALKLTKPVIVSPSMSGSFALKYLIMHSDKIAGFVPVSPVRTNILDQDICGNKIGNDTASGVLSKDCQKIMNFLDTEDHVNLNCIKVPTLVVFGEKDRGINSARLCLLPNSQGAEIPQGRHAAYLSNPELWHKLLYNFLDVVNKILTCA